MDISTGQLAGAIAAIVAGVVFLIWLNRRSASGHVTSLMADAQREKARREAMAELDAQGKLLYQLVERQDAVRDELRVHSRHLDAIKAGTTIIAVLLVLSVIVGCLVAVFGLSLSAL